MRRKIIITVILVMALVLAMIPFGIINAAAPTMNFIKDGDFANYNNGSDWDEDISDMGGSAVTYTSGYAQLVNDASISQRDISVDTIDQIFSVDVTPTTWESYASISIEVFLQDGNSTDVGEITKEYVHGEASDVFTQGTPTTISFNLKDATPATDKSIEGATKINVSVGVVNGGTVQFDNFQLAGNRSSGGSSNSSGGSSAPRPLTPDEWVAKNLNIDQLLNLYGPTPTGFLGMLYDNSMQRIPDSSGLIYWNEKLTLQLFGANQVVEHFLFSDETGAKVAAMTNEDYISYLYTTLLSRNSDTDGYNNWLSYINSGFSKEETLRAFLNNEEWINICKLFNITP